MLFWTQSLLQAATRSAIQRATNAEFIFEMSATSGGSPVTGIIEENQVIIDFGKHEGKSVEEIAELDPAFYERLATEKENGVFAIRRHKDKTFRLYINPLSGIDH